MIVIRGILYFLLGLIGIIAFICMIVSTPFIIIGGLGYSIWKDGWKETFSEQW